MTTTDKTIERYIERAIDRFLTDPPDSDFQRGYFDAPSIGKRWPER